MAAATAAVLPALDDPGTSSVFHGLRGWLSRSVLNHGSRPTAWIVLPIMTAPALRRRSTAMESCSAVYRAKSPSGQRETPSPPIGSLQALVTPGTAPIGLPPMTPPSELEEASVGERVDPNG